MDSNNITPLFLCGHHRSGTSLITHLLDGHSKLIVNNVESQFYTHFYPKAKDLDVNGRIKIAYETLMRVWRKDVEYYDKYLSSYDIQETRDLFISELNKSNKELEDYFVASVLAIGKITDQFNEQVKHWVDKTPHTEYFTELIYEKWPKTKCIHVIRDPRDLHATLRKRHGDVFSVRTTILNWRRSVKAMEYNMKRYGHEHYMYLRYEDFVNNPEPWLEKIRFFLGIKDEEILRKPTLCGGMLIGRAILLKHNMRV
jgi:hypothetical protein